MTDTHTSTISYSDEEIARLKREEIDRYERLQRMGTMPARYVAELKPNRKERRKWAALSRVKGDHA